MEAQRARLQETVQGAYPEDVLVFDVIGSITDFWNAVAAISELSWLTERAGANAAPDADFYDQQNPNQQLTTSIYFVAATQSGLNQVLSLWNRYQQGQPFPRGQAPWRELFSHLRDVRRWGRRDRLEATGALEIWSAELGAGAETVNAEIELWYRDAPARRRIAEAEVLDALRQLQGEVLDGPYLHEEAGVHVMLVRLSREAARTLSANEHVALAQSAAIQTLRAQALVRAVTSVGTAEGPPFTPGAPPRGEPIVAVLDGFVVENHPALQERLIVDDPHDWGDRVPVTERRHGTAVVSVALWQDLRSPSQPHSRKLYVRPVLVPDGSSERIPSERLLHDVLHEAVARMFEGNDPAAPEVAVINLSIGDARRPFDGREISPLARVLDALSWHYHVLFIVAAGNCHVCEDLEEELDVLERDPAARHRALLQHVRRTWLERSLLSPAEAINPLVVGALDHDEGPAPGPDLYAPYDGMRAPALYSCVGPGHRRAVKPDLLAPGGRGPVRMLWHRGGTRVLLADAGQSEAGGGLRVATPPSRREGFAIRHDRGTSFAAPWVTNCAARLSDALDAWIAASGTDLFALAPRAVWLKALLVHSASRRDFEDFVGPVVEGPDPRSRGQDSKRLQDRLVGFGVPEVERVMACEAHRVTVLAGGLLREDKAHEYAFPLPSSLLAAGKLFSRSLRVTLAWLSPPWPTSALYRGAALKLDTLEVDGLSFNDGREADHNTVNRGTVIHTVMSGRGAAKFQQGDQIRLKVNCWADAATRLDQPIPYALVITFEVDAALGVDIYQDVRLAIAQPVRITP